MQTIQDRRSVGLGLILVIAAFFLLHLLTTPNYIGDTQRYSGDVVLRTQGQVAPLWEFGHLLWRPWGYLGYQIFGDSIAQQFGDSPRNVAIRIFNATTFVCAIACCLLLYLILVRFGPWWAAALITVAVEVSNPFLNYSRSGAPYLPALMFLLLSIWLFLRASTDSTRRSTIFAGAAGLAFALCLTTWFPFCLVGLGLVAIPVVIGRSQSRSDKLRLIVAFLAVLGITTIVLFASGAQARGIHSVAEFRQWLSESDNGWMQSRTMVRLATGLPRAAFDLGVDTLRLKRWYLHDPYNPVATSQILNTTAFKIGLFFLTITAVILAAFLERSTRPLLWIFAVAGLPLLYFAVFLFEPGSPERFLPVFPFLAMIVTALLCRWQRNRAITALVVLFLCTVAVTNILGTSRSAMTARVDKVRARMNVVTEAAGGHPGRVFLFTMGDDIIAIPDTYPHDASLKPKFSRTHVIEVANKRAFYWKSDFAKTALSSIEKPEEVWLSDRLLAPTPRAEWGWAEGDDKVVSWVQIRDFFRQFQTDSAAPFEGDGFRRLAQTPENIALLRRYAQDPN